MGQMIHQVAWRSSTWEVTTRSEIRNSEAQRPPLYEVVTNVRDLTGAETTDSLSMSRIGWGISPGSSTGSRWGWGMGNRGPVSNQDLREIGCLLPATRDSKLIANHIILSGYFDKLI